MKQKLELVEGKVQLLKSRKPILEKKQAQSIHANISRQNTPKPSMILSNTEPPRRLTIAKPIQKTYAQIAASRPVQEIIKNT